MKLQIVIGQSKLICLLLGGIIMDFLLDQRGNCTSFMLKVKFPDYHTLIDCAYQNRGGIEGKNLQRYLPRLWQRQRKKGD